MHSQVDGVSVSQLYDMRSDKEERRVGGFPPEDEVTLPAEDGTKVECKALKCLPVTSK